MMEKLLLFVAQLRLVIHATEIPDMSTIFKVPVTSDVDSFNPVNVEIHSLSNTLGKLFLLDNQTIISPNSSRALPPYGCFPTPSCGWKSNATWTSSTISFQQLRMLSLPLDGANLPCEYSKGECQVSCRNSDGKFKCSCPTYFSLNSNNKTCYSNSRCRSVLTASKGNFQSPNYPSNYDNNEICSWIIVTSKERRIRLSIPQINTENCCDRVIVFDGVEKEIARGHGDGASINAVSTGNVMLITFTSDYSNVATGFRATYETELIPASPVPELQNESGVITSSLKISQPNLCVSLIYALPSSGSLDIYAEQSLSGKIQFRQINSNKINGWYISRYVSSSSLDIKDNSTKLSVHVEGKESKIFDIRECSSDGDDVYDLPGRYWKNFLSANTTSQSRFSQSGETVSNCSHGGAYDRNAKTCVCPPGFAGPTCTEACGPNHFGQNCSGSCSSFQDGCKNIIFCNMFHDCSCATGFTGKNCEEECEPGTYGANCHNLCGKCKEGTCDKYTGECDDLCEDGYYPPLCQDRYVFLREAPKVVEKSFNSVVISANFTNPNGRGIPHLYEVQYKEIGSSKWNKTLIQEIDLRSIVQINVNDLNVGTEYSLRIVIICEDGNSYDGDAVRTVQFETQCQVPDSSVYEMEISHITSSSFSISWNYPVYSDKWCPVDSFQIILQDQWKTYSQEIPFANNYTSFSSLLSSHQYVVHVCAKTRHGNAPCSEPIAVTTEGKGMNNIWGNTAGPAPHGLRRGVRRIKNENCLPVILRKPFLVLVYLYFPFFPWLQSKVDFYIN